MGERFTRQRPFLKSVLAEANRQRRNQLLRLANADQINALSELAMNTVRGVVPRSRDTVRLLRPYQDTLKQLMQRRRSVKNRRELMMAQSGALLADRAGPRRTSTFGIFSVLANHMDLLAPLLPGAVLGL